MKKPSYSYNIVFTICIILFLTLLSSCIRPLEAFKNKETHKKGKVLKATNISDDASSYSHTIGIGMKRAIRAGYDMSYLLKNKSKIEFSADYNFGKANKNRQLPKEVVNYTEKRLTESVSLSLDASFPISKSDYIKTGAIPITDGRKPETTAHHASSGASGAPLLVPDSVFYAVHKFRQIRTIDATVGVDHFYSVFGSGFYKRHLNDSDPGGSYRFPDEADQVTINQGTYYLKAGASMNLYANTNIDASLYGRKFWGSVIRELQVTASLSYGLMSTISDLNLSYTSQENGSFVERVDLVDPLDYDLQYSAIGGEISLSWKQYFYDSYAMKYSLLIGSAPGYYETTGDNFFIGASLRFGVGRMK